MLAIRIIPTLLHRGATLIKGVRFDGSRSVGHVQQAARIHATRGVDEMIVLDIGATPDRRGPDTRIVEAIADGMFSPITIGGGVRSMEQVGQLLAAGADKIAINTAALERPYLINEITARFGCQAIVVAIDASDGCVMTNHGKTRLDGLPATTWAQMAEELGAGEILLTAVDREGTMLGYDLDLIRSVCDKVGIPVIAHGGCSGYPDMHKAIQAGASAVAAGALFQFTDATPRGAAEYLDKQGIEVRT